MRKKQQMLLYRELAHQDLIDYMEELNEGDGTHLCELISGLVEMTARHGFEGNVWHNFLAYTLANHENAFSMACEVRGKVAGSINTLALHDFRLFREWFDFDLAGLAEKYGMEELAVLADFRGSGETGSRIYNPWVHDRIQDLAVSLAAARDEEEFLDCVTAFYRDFGVGKFGLHKAFRVEDAEAKVEILPITKTDAVTLEDLVGYEIQKKKLIENTEAFVEGRPANNCLLYGDAGTGKSSSIKAILNAYYGRGLRLIEVYKHQFQDLTAVISQIKNRNYRFILYMDDLSFEDFEIEYKYLKAIIEGGMERRPDNVLIYATSNRRHLIREKYSDKKEPGDDIHSNDTVQEKLSLSARFGVTIYYGRPDRKEFDEIVRTLAEREGIRMPEEELLAEANRWELSHGGLSGRCASQFITHLLSRGGK